VVFDVAGRPAALPDGADFVQGDVRDEAALRRCLRGAAVTFHTASYGMSGSSALHTRTIWEINVQGAP
jgi:nucleoside-diphosphate-sugar epimerase